MLEVPHRPDFTIDQNWQAYTAEEHGVWRTLYRQQAKLLVGRAAPEFLDGMAALPLGEEQIPDVDRLNEKLMKLTGWRVVCVPGLVPDGIFFEHLANRRFPAGLRRGRFARDGFRHADAAGASLLGDGRVRPDPRTRRLAHLWFGDRVLQGREPLCAR